MATSSVQNPRLNYYSSKLFHGSPLHSRVNEESIRKETLAGFPSKYTSERVWSGPDIASKEDEWVTVLSEQDQDHALRALRYFQG